MCEHQLGQPVLCCPAQVPTSVGVWGELLPHLILSLGPVGAAIPLQGVHPAPVACGMSAFGQLDGPPCRTQHWLLPIPPHPLSLLPPPALSPSQLQMISLAPARSRWRVLYHNEFDPRADLGPTNGFSGPQDSPA